MQLEYKISGESNKETILFVHGAGSNASQFNKQHEFFSDKYKVVSLSLRGHGLSPQPSPNHTEHYSLDHHVNDIIELINNLSLCSIHYVGNSAGGVLGYIVTSRLHHLFLSITTFGTTGQMNFPKLSAPLVKAFDSLMIRLFKEKYLKFAAMHTGLNSESRDAIYKMFLMASDAVPHFRYHLANYNFLHEIENLQIPYCLIQSEFDKDINRSLKTTIEAISKNEKAKIISFKGAGHIANLDMPDAFNRLLLSIFIESSQGNS